MSRHDGVDAAALAGCKPDLLTSTVIANGSAMPPQEFHGNRALALGPDGKLCELRGVPPPAWPAAWRWAAGAVRARRARVWRGLHGSPTCDLCTAAGQCRALPPPTSGASSQRLCADTSAPACRRLHRGRAL